MTTKILTSQLDGFLSYICSGKFTIKFHDSKWQLDFTTKKIGWPEKHISVQVAKLEDLLFETWAAVRKLNVYSLGGNDQQEIQRLMDYGYSQDFLELYIRLHPVVKNSESYTCQCGAFVLKGPHVGCIILDKEKHRKSKLTVRSDAEGELQRLLYNFAGATGTAATFNTTKAQPFITQAMKNLFGDYQPWNYVLDVEHKSCGKDEEIEANLKP